MSAGFSDIIESTDKSDTIAETSREVKSTQLKLRSLLALVNEQLVDVVSFMSGSILLDSCGKERSSQWKFIEHYKTKIFKNKYILHQQLYLQK